MKLKERKEKRASLHLGFLLYIVKIYTTFHVPIMEKKHIFPSDFLFR